MVKGALTFDHIVYLHFSDLVGKSKYIKTNEKGMKAWRLIKS